eukprot:GABV01009758.1.p2 GENE.GABV01009758.1~~GABV01009758.1.p2  ORF type:complete len:127 (+),score=11.81 GABV01009758.1:106-486(+)
MYIAQCTKNKTISTTPMTQNATCPNRPKNAKSNKKIMAFQDCRHGAQTTKSSKGIHPGERVHQGGLCGENAQEGEGCAEGADAHKDPTVNVDGPKRELRMVFEGRHHPDAPVDMKKPESNHQAHLK